MKTKEKRKLDVRMLLNLALAPLLLASAGVPALGADVIAGKKLAAQCAACHGVGGVSMRPGVPTLAGQDETYLVKAMRDFRSGSRKDERMSASVAALSDKDIDNLAAYYRQLGPRSLDTTRTR
jgi:cytochrome c553